MSIVRRILSGSSISPSPASVCSVPLMTTIVMCMVLTPFIASAALLSRSIAGPLAMPLVPVLPLVLAVVAVAVGGAAVSVGGTAVSVGGAGVAVGVSPPHAYRPMTAIST